jgi:hypothetical protein
VLTFLELLEELSQQSVTIPPADARRMVQRFGEGMLQMGRLGQDGSLRIDVDCIVEAVQSLGNERLAQAVEGLRRTEQVVDLLESVGSLVDRVSEARRRKLAGLIDEFQSTPDDVKAHRKWAEIEKMIFGVDFDAAR